MTHDQAKPVLQPVCAPPPALCRSLLFVEPHEQSEAHKPVRVVVSDPANAAKFTPGAEVRVTGRLQDGPPGLTKNEKVVKADRVDVLSTGPAAATVARRVLKPQAAGKPKPPVGPPAPGTRVRVPNPINLSTVKALFIPSALHGCSGRRAGEHARAALVEVHRLLLPLPRLPCCCCFHACMGSGPIQPRVRPPLPLQSPSTQHAQALTLPARHQG